MNYLYKSKKATKTPGSRPQSELWYFDERRKPDEFLDKLVNTTTLTTKQVAHHDIESLGSDVHRSNTRNSQRDKESAVEEAERIAVEKCKFEYEQVLADERNRAKDEKAKALRRLQRDCEKQAEQTQINCNIKERESLYILKCKLTEEKERALAKQLDDCERDKRASIELAVQRLYKKLSGSASSIFEETLTAALQLEHDKYAEEREAAVSEERSRCEEECGVKLKAERNLHRHEIMKLRERLAVLSAEKSRPALSNLHPASGEQPFATHLRDDDGDVTCTGQARHRSRVASTQTSGSSHHR